MKSRTLIFMSIFLLAVTFLFAEDVKKEISDEDFIEAWSGTWINLDYGKGSFAQKLIYYSDGIYDEYILVTDTMRYDWGKIIILDKWLDSEGNVWCRTHWEGTLHGGKGYQMVKISNSGNTLEVIWASESFPIEEWEPDRFEYNYEIHYRQ